jgi:hypothetical protein
MFTTYNQTTKQTGGKITWDGSKFILTGSAPTLGISTVGSTTQPIYLNAGVPAAISSLGTTLSKKLTIQANGTQKG